MSWLSSLSYQSCNIQKEKGLATHTEVINQDQKQKKVAYPEKSVHAARSGSNG